jgi:hypothetical protein
MKMCSLKNARYLEGDNMKVKAAVHLGTKGLIIRELDLEEPRSDEVLIKTVAQLDFPGHVQQENV